MSLAVKFFSSGGMLFSDMGRAWEDKMELMLSERGIEIYKPWRDSKEEFYRKTLSPTESAKKIFELDRDGVDECQAFFLLAEGQGGLMSSGSAWETGYAFARGKYIICLRTDFRGTLGPIIKQCLYDKKICSKLQDFLNLADLVKERIIHNKIQSTSYSPTTPGPLAKVYIAAPHYSTAEIKFAEDVERLLQGMGLEVVLYWKSLRLKDKWLKEDDHDWPDIFNQKVTSLDECDGVVALLDGPDCESETSWDCGYAYAKSKPVFGIRTDFRHLSKFGKVNIMLGESITDGVLCESPEELQSFIKRFIAKK